MLLVPRDHKAHPYHGTLELMPSCAPLNEFIYSSLKCVVYDLPMQGGTAEKRMVVTVLHWRNRDGQWPASQGGLSASNKYGLITYNEIDELFSA